MEITFTAKTSELRRIQDLVKKHNLYFQGNPIVIEDRAVVSLEGNVESFNLFNTELESCRDTGSGFLFAPCVDLQHEICAAQSHNLYRDGRLVKCTCPCHRNRVS